MTIVYDEKDGALLVAQQVADVFKGANSMAKFVGENLQELKRIGDPG